MTNLITQFDVQATPAQINFNFDGVREYLEAELEKYENVLVTIDTLPADKKLAQEIRAKARDISRLRIDTKNELSAPISDFEAKMKELEGMCKTLADSITNQVSKFEQIRLDNLTQQLMTLRDKLRTELNIEEVHFSAEFDDLIKLGSLTKTDNLTKSVREEMEQRVNKELQAQQRTEMRLLQLENECLKAGMDAPMTRQNVEAFLYTDDDTYNAQLSGLIQSELARQEQARIAHERRLQEEAARAQREAETKALAEAQQIKEQEKIAAQSETQPQPELQNYQPQPEPQPQPQTNAVTKRVAAYFTVTVPSHVPNHAIENKLKRMLSDAGITSLTNIEVM